LVSGLEASVVEMTRWTLTRTSQTVVVKASVLRAGDAESWLQLQQMRSAKQPTDEQALEEVGKVVAVVSELVAVVSELVAVVSELVAVVSEATVLVATLYLAHAAAGIRAQIQSRVTMKARLQTPRTLGRVWLGLSEAILCSGGRVTCACG
jgi:hypothetical protein